MAIESLATSGTSATSQTLRSTSIPRVETRTENSETSVASKEDTTGTVAAPQAANSNVSDALRGSIVNLVV